MEEKITERKSCCSSNEDQSIPSISNEQEKARQSIRERYSKIAENKSHEISSDDDLVKEQTQKKSPLYTDDELKSIPEGAHLGLGSGNPVALANINAGETVVDLGSGAGIDCFLAANKVGNTGKVIGVDMSPNMIDLARDNALKNNYQNVEFRLGEIEYLPIANNTADIVISNCVINLATDKSQVFKEALRILKPGGRMIISDIMFANELPTKVQSIFKNTSGCVSRAILSEKYLEIIRNVGFDNVEIINSNVIRPQNKPKTDEKEGLAKVTIISDGNKMEVELSREERDILETAIISAHVQARKPF